MAEVGGSASVEPTAKCRRFFVLFPVAGSLQFWALRMVARWLIAVCIGCWACWASPAQAVEGEARLGGDRAVIFGSSSVRQAFGRLLRRELEERGYQVTLEGVSAAGFARPDFRDVNAIAARLPISEETGVVLVYLGVNDAQSLWLSPSERKGAKRPWVSWRNPRWNELYEGRVRRFIDRLCARGAERVVMLLPVDVVRPRLQERLQRVRAAQARAAATSSCGTAVATRGDRGRFESGGARRRRDGFHMTPHGARMVWRRIREQVLDDGGEVRAAALPR